MNTWKFDRTGQGKLSLRGNRGNISEFATVLIPVVFVFLIPMINLASFAFTYMWLDFASTEIAHSAAMSEDRTAALQNVVSSSRRFSQFLPLMNYQGGLEDSGCRLSILITRDNTLIKQLPAQSPLPPEFRPTAGQQVSGGSYLYSLELTCNIVPLLDLSGLPFVGQAPLIGTMTPVTMTKCVHIENPDGLNG